MGWITGEIWFDLYCREEICLSSKEPRHFARQVQASVQWTILTFIVAEK
jgi:hypothetical protein